MRIIFIPGLDEDISIFDQIHPHLAGEKVFVDNWRLLSDLPEENLTVKDYAQYLIDRFSITQSDVVIGHSMGGWIALQIKQLTGCKVVQIASWTNPKKKITIPLPRFLMYWIAKKGFGFNDVTLKILVWIYYKNKPSAKIFSAIFNRTRHGDLKVFVKQLKIVFNPLKQPLTASPDLRIHALYDHLVKYPDEPFVTVPGDHFSLCTYPDSVYKPITHLLETLQQ